MNTNASGGTVRASWSARIRTTHRWVSLVFTATVVANFAAMTQGQPPAWVTYSPLPPLAVMLLTGLCLFALPFVARRRRAPMSRSRV